MSSSLLSDRTFRARIRAASPRPHGTWFFESTGELCPWGVVLVFSTWVVLVGYIGMEALG